MSLILSAAIPASSVSAAMPAAIQIGVAAAVKGKVEAFSTGFEAVGREISSGKPLYLNERITTDAQGHMQIMLRDETVFTIGPNSSMVLDEFIYDPASGSGKVTAEVTKGVFRFVTGKIGHNNPSNMKVNFPTGTMGIRGTIVAGQVDLSGRATCVLLGPGANNNAGDRIGAFRLENAHGGVDVTRPGYGSNMDRGSPPSLPALIPPTQLNAMLGQLAPPANAPAADRTQAAGPPAGRTASNNRGGFNGPAAGQPRDRRGPNGPGPGNYPGANNETASPDNGGPNDPAGPSHNRRNPNGPGNYPANGGPNDPAAPFYNRGNFNEPDNSPGMDNGTASSNNGFNRFGHPPPMMDGPDMFQGPNDFGPGYGARSMTQLAGQDRAGAIGDLFDMQMTAGVMGLVGENMMTAVMDNGKQTFFDRIVDGSAEWDGVRLIQRGSGQYSGGGFFALTRCGGGDCSSPSGYFTYNLEIDFGARTIGGSNSSAYISAFDDATGVSVTDSLSVSGRSFAGLSGAAVISQTSESGFFSTDFTLLSVNGVADTVGAHATYDDGFTAGAGYGGAPLHLFRTGAAAIDWNEARAVPSGSGHYAGGGPFLLTQCNGGPCGMPRGFFNYLLEIDFGARTIGSSSSGVNLFAYDPTTGVSINESMAVPSRSFSALSGPATVRQTSGYFTVDFSLLSTNHAADTIEAAARYDSGSTVGDGLTSSPLEAAVAATNAISDWSGVQSIPSGSGRYAGGGVFNMTRCGGGSCGSPSGFFNYLLEIDFGARTYGGSHSGAYVNAADPVSGASIRDSLSISAHSFSGLTGSALVSQTSESGNLALSMSLKDVNGFAGLGLDATATYNDGSNAGSGTASTVFELEQTLTDSSDWSGVLAIPSGAGLYAGSGNLILTQCGGPGISCVSPTGFFSFLLKMDFGKQTFGGVGSGAYVYASDSARGVSVTDSLAIAETSYTGRTGSALISQTSNSTYFTVNYLLKDVGSISAAGIDVEAVYNDASTIGSGFASALQAAVGGASLWSDVRALPSGNGFYRNDGSFTLTQCGGNPCGAGAGGSFVYLLAIDFGAHTIGGFGSGAALNAYNPASHISISDFIEISAIDFSLTSGVARLPTQTSQSGNFSIDFSLSDVDGVAAMELDATATYDDGSTEGSGFSSSSMQRFSNWSAVTAIQRGTGRYEGTTDFLLTKCAGGDCANPTGILHYGLAIDFGAKTFGGAGSGAYVTASDDAVSIADGLDIPVTSFSGNSGFARVAQTSVSGNFSVDFTLRDVGSVAALAAEIYASYDDNGTNAGVGHMDASLDATPTFSNGTSSWDEVRTLHNGTGSYSANGTSFALTTCDGQACVSPSGSFSFNLSVDFGKRNYDLTSTMSASASNLASGSVSGSLNVNDASFANASGSAAISAASGNYALSVALKNSGGAPAALADATATYSNSATSTAGSGVALNVAKQ